MPRVVVDIFDVFRGGLELFFRFLRWDLGGDFCVSFGGGSLFLGVGRGEVAGGGGEAPRMHPVRLLAVRVCDARRAQQPAVLEEHSSVKVLRKQRHFTFSFFKFSLTFMHIFF